MNDAKPVRPIRRDELRKFKVIAVVFGSRAYDDYDMFVACLEGFIHDWKIVKETTVWVSGMADGPDKFIIRWCKENGWRWFECPADWDNIDVPGAVIRTNKFGKKYNALAGHNRNQDMANISTHGLGFWDGKSKGTEDMIERCAEKHLNFRVIRVPDQRKNHGEKQEGS